MEEVPAAQVRRLHIGHEILVKSIGLLFYLYGAAILTLVEFIARAALARGRGPTLGEGVFLVAFAIVNFLAGIGLRCLQGWVWIPVVMLSGISLLSFPLFTAFNVYVLYLVFSRKGVVVFSQEYQRFIRETPQIKYKMPITTWAVLGAVLAGLIVVAYAAISARSHP